MCRQSSSKFVGCKGCLDIVTPRVCTDMPSITTTKRRTYINNIYTNYSILLDQRTSNDWKVLCFIVLCNFIHLCHQIFGLPEHSAVRAFPPLEKISQPWSFKLQSRYILPAVPIPQWLRSLKLSTGCGSTRTHKCPILPGANQEVRPNQTRSLLASGPFASLHY